ncbi:hypothetical protein Hte_004189 [Hypoxylon texense]
MPLHLLGKKSWNVYNPKNIERVKRDEAAAREREEAEEQRQQEVDAERRLAILRGEVPPPLPPASPSVDNEGPSRKRDRDEDAAGASLGRERRKRKRAGEDDTDFELRLARERAGATQTTGDALVKSKDRSNAPLVDHTGHIDLFPGERTIAHSQKNEEAEKEAAKKKREYEDQYMMRFSNAAGRDGLVGPWYAKGGDMKDMVDGNLEPPSKDVWGNEDPRRKEREAARVVSNDPLAMMKRGAAKVREVEKERRQKEDGDEREGKAMTISRGSVWMGLLQVMPSLTPETTMIMGEDGITIPGMKVSDRGAIPTVERAGTKVLAGIVGAMTGIGTMIVTEIETGSETKARKKIETETEMEVKECRNTTAGD